MIEISEECLVKQEDLLISLNPEIIDIVEKVWVKSTATTKEQKEKQVLEIFKIFLIQLNEHLNKRDRAEITDLILDKSVYISDTTGIYEWPNAESLKVSNLHRMALFLYSYVKSRLSLLIYKRTAKLQKDAYHRAFENLIKCLEVYLEVSSTVDLQETMLFIIFKDLFEFYLLTRESPYSENKEKVMEDIMQLIEAYKEESNIVGLAKLNSIEKTAENNLFIGSLTTVLALKIAYYENQTDSTLELLNEMENINRHLDHLIKLSFLSSCDFAVMRTMSCFVTQKEEKGRMENCYQLLSIFKQLKIFKKFVKNSKMTDIFEEYEAHIKILLLLYFVSFGMKIDENILSFLNFSNEDLTSANLNNLLPISQIFGQMKLQLFAYCHYIEKINQYLIELGEKAAITSIRSEIGNQISEMIYQKSSFFGNQFSSDLISDSVKFSTKFVNLNDMLEKIK